MNYIQAQSPLQNKLSSPPKHSEFEKLKLSFEIIFT